VVGQRGQYAARFWDHALEDLTAGRRHRALVNFGRSVVASPPHCLKAACTSMPCVSTLIGPGHHPGLPT
jgi:hypothetical protein